MCYDWDWPGGESEFNRAIALNPNYPNAHHLHGAIGLMSVGRLEEATAEDKRALELDPLSVVINWSLGMDFYLAKRNDQAIEQERKTDARIWIPNFKMAHDDLLGQRRSRKIHVSGRNCGV